MVYNNEAELVSKKVSLVYDVLSCQQVNMFLMLYFFGYFMRQDLVYTSFGFYDGHPTMIGLFLVFQFIFSPYSQVCVIVGYYYVCVFACVHGIVGYY